MVIGDRERIAVVGANGTGKTTLLKIISGEIESSAGRMTTSRFTSIGYLPQDGVLQTGRPVFDEVASAAEDIVMINNRIEAVNREIEVLSSDPARDAEELESLVEELGKMHHHLEDADGYTVDVKIKQILSGLGFAEKDFSRSTDEFSGGWQMRIEVAKLLLKEPSVLLLDEPTNHLDINSLQWLESYLQVYEGAVLLVSHDRRFLDNLARRTLEISRGKLTEYRGNYSFYEEEKTRRLLAQQAAGERRQKLIEETMRFVERFRYKATKARQVQSRLKMLEKLERIETGGDEKDIAFEFPTAPHSGRIALALEGITKAYDGNIVFSDLALAIERNDRIALMGPNGSGKSTLARIIAGIEPFQGGARKMGHQAVVSYYAQDQTGTLDPGKTILETLEAVATGDHRRNLRSLLGRFLFTEDDVFKTVSVLSGGEKSRLALARMLLIPANLLIFDEPTNHLDMSSKAVLQAALMRFEGAFVIVSHDRDFLEPLIEKVLDFDNGFLRVTLGTVDEYTAKWQNINNNALPRDPSGKVLEKKTPLQQEKERRREDAQLRQKLYQKIKPLREHLENLEKEIGINERRKQAVETLLADPATYENGAAARALNLEYGEVVARLKVLYEKWATVHEEIDQAEFEAKGGA